ncbi:uracil-xanthine permease family protein [Clostridium botulinum]|uniref:uracil-xanthine permease family protein n=1 Tax=Clostridium botulinum TaxID=1491 RepID=UPI0004D49829|nr:uracil-xanthine permease family protein [Clostridium botulinum]KEI01106.1 uracil transporter [Clostridium botulinum C/D str. BKT75002]KEI13415.1 uracil transporter [Clostridium botulinum C/D str. BKT2873]MCD3351432.1 uracil-xanthine permease [Clostridium botulinum D/C]MCD3360388.1 uracil-xanthine permease [Clostridium botulinum D/C]MCD3362786.1 uracil-xanthine permease [Clostridium botulinum D/C]
MSENAILKENLEMKEKSKVLECIKRMILALQHLIAMFGATVLVPILTGFDPSVALLSAGVGTLIFHLCTKRKVPVFLGSSFAFIGSIIMVRDKFGGDLAYAQGGIMVAGFIYVIMSFAVKKIGVERIRKILPNHVVGPMIIVIGLSLIPTAIDMASKNFKVAVITLAMALIITLKGRGFLKQLSILIAVIVGYLVSLKLGIVDTSIITSAPIVSMPNFRLPKFDIGAIAIIAPVVLAVFMEHIGDITTNGEVVGKNFIEDPGLNRTLLGDGLATSFAAFIGGPANTTYGENTGVLAITKNYNPAILRITAVFAVCLGFIAKIGGFLRSIPVPVMGGISLMLFSMISLIGFKTLGNGKVKFNLKNILVMATIIIIGLGTSYIEKFIGLTLGITITSGVKITGLSLAAISGVILNAIINRKSTLENK